MDKTSQINKKNIIAMRALALNAIKRAGQGHTGMAISAAPLTYTLYTKFINIDKSNPKWINRDRFVLSAGHGSMSLYSLLHFAGLLSIEDIKNHKKENSLTPGHPEYEEYNYVDASTGPLGQGIAISVGMAMAEEYLRNKFDNLKNLINHYTYTIVGDGCLQEGISYESMSLAGKLNLSKLIVLHDSNDFQIDGNVNETFIEDLEKRVTAMNWSYIKCSNDPIDIQKAIEWSKKINKPSFVEIKTIFGEGTSAQAKNSAHGLKVDEKEEAVFSTYYNYKMKEFQFDEEIYNYFFENVIERGQKNYQNWKELYDSYAIKFPDEIKEFDKITNGNFPDVSKIISHEKIINKNCATRDYIKEYFKQIVDSKIPLWFLLGSADLAGPTSTFIDLSKSFANNRKNSDVFYGIREFSMSAIQIGLTLHRGVKSFASTFLAFSDYMKSSLRLSAINNLPTSFIFTHDSYQVGGDGPTHQPVDQLAMLRAIPNLYVYRPCDEVESQFTFESLFNEKKGTRVGIFSRQPLKSNHPTSVELSKKGGYILYDDKDADVTLVGAGSEIDLLLQVKNYLADKGKKAKIVSVPCLDLFIMNDEKYLSQTLQSKNGIMSIEPSSDYMWYKLFKYGNNYAHLGAFTYGLSMDGPELYSKKGFNLENIIKILQLNKLI